MRSYQEISATSRDGRAFSNSTEWEVFSANWCWRGCVNDRNEDCPLIAFALATERTPREWEADDGTVDRCSEFQEEPILTEPMTPAPVVRPDGEFEGQMDILQELGSPGGLLSTGSVQTAVSGTRIPPEAPGALRGMLAAFFQLLETPEITDPNRPVKLVCGKTVLTHLASHPDTPPDFNLSLATLYGMPVELDEQADPLGWRLVNAYGIPIRGGVLDA